MQGTERYCRTAAGTEIFSVVVRDGDTGIPRQVELSLQGDSLGYFQLARQQQAEDGTLTASIVTTDNLIGEHTSRKTAR